MEFSDRVRSLRQNEAQAIEWMFVEFKADVERCFGRRPPEDRADLVQDVFLTAIRRIHTFEGESEATLRAWLRSIAFHRWHHRWEAEQVRSRYAGPPIELLLDCGQPDGSLADEGADPAAAVAERQLVDRMLQDLTPRQATVVRAKIIQGLTTADIANSWQVPHERVRGLYKRGVARLRTERWRDALKGAA